MIIKNNDKNIMSLENIMTPEEIEKAEAIQLREESVEADVEDLTEFDY